MAGRGRRRAVSQIAPSEPQRVGGETPHEHGSLTLAVRVTPRASRDTLTLEDDGGLRARLTAPPVEGAANEALISLLAERLRLPKRAITIVRGAASRDKHIAIAGITADELRARLTP
ncbi:MAG TPA: DUF167 domain-containing protein [Ktedonobacterales bacterium]